MRAQDFAADRNRVSGATYRLMNEVPTLALIVIVVMVVVRAVLTGRSIGDLTWRRHL